MKLPVIWPLVRIGSLSVGADTIWPSRTMARWRWKPPSLPVGLLRGRQVVEQVAALGVEAEVDGQLAALVVCRRWR